MKHQVWIHRWLMTAALALLATAHARATDAGDPLAAVRTAWEHSMTDGDAAAAAALFATYAVQLRPGRPSNRGRDAIAASYQEDFAAARVTAVKMTPSGTRVEHGTALQHGTFTITWLERIDGAQPMDLHGRYLLQARRNPSGQWLIELEMHTIEPKVPEAQLR